MKIIPDSQHGFNKSKSADTALFTFIKHIVSALDQRELIAAFFIDLSKALDSHNRRIDFEKFDRFGIRGKLCSGMDELFFNRANSESAAA